MSAAIATPPDPTTSPWLHLAAPVGRVATYFLIGGSFLQLFAPLAFLVDLGGRTEPDAPGGSLLLLLSDPGHLLSIGDFVLILGVVILAAAVFLILFAFLRADRKVGFVPFLLGATVLACLAAWVPVMLYAQGRATGTVASLDAAAATGGWGLASCLMLGASLAYLFLAVRIQNGSGKLGLPSFKWPIYGAVGVLGSVAIAGFFASGGADLDAFSLGLVLKATLIPFLGVMAFSDLRDRFPAWARVPLHDAPITAAKSMDVPIRSPAKPVMAVRVARPMPPPPDD